MTFPVFVNPQLSANDVTAGGTVMLVGAEARHAAVVRRIKPGEIIDVVDGHGLRVTAEVTLAAKNEIQAAVVKVVQEPASNISITLVQALAKGGRDEQAIETATEFGVDNVIPWESQRCIVSWENSVKEAKARAKWEAAVLAAGKQARRAAIPVVSEKLTSRQLAAWISAQVGAGGCVFVCHEEGTQPLVQLLQRFKNGKKALMNLYRNH
ncbi:RsmE family RNA methyltransferase [Arcanobacterium hippocoleae]